VSSFRTHALIGAVCGLAVADMLDVPVSINRLSWKGLVVVCVSAVVALWPDADQSHSWMGKNIQRAIVLGVTALGLILGVLLVDVRFGGAKWSTFEYNPPLLMLPLLGAALGFVLVGPGLGKVLLRGLRVIAGGHRRLTHSLVLATALVVLGFLIRQFSTPLATIPWALAYGIVVHDLGDVVTVQGVPLFYPVVRHSYRMPRFVTRSGERLAAAWAVGAGLAMLWYIS
jgi:membrane-bound metal-dependent hydrolase YbcI (DUF457 family)